MTAGFDAGDQPDTGAAQCECVSRMDTSKCPVHGGDNRGWGRRQSDYVLDGSPDAVAIVRADLLAQPADAEAVGLRARLAAVEARFFSLFPHAGDECRFPDDACACRCAEARNALSDAIAAVLADTEDRPGGGMGGRATPDSFGRTKPIYEGEA